jgi:hypothetical protein
VRRRPFWCSTFLGLERANEHVDRAGRLRRGQSAAPTRPQPRRDRQGRHSEDLAAPLSQRIAVTPLFTDRLNRGHLLATLVEFALDFEFDRQRCVRCLGEGHEWHGDVGSPPRGAATMSPFFRCRSNCSSTRLLPVLMVVVALLRRQVASLQPQATLAPDRAGVHSITGSTSVAPGASVRARL